MTITSAPARYFAEIRPADNVVLRVIVAESALDCLHLLGGHWEETLQGHSIERYARPGMVFAPDDPRRFLRQGES
jgi:hypothetical protein